MNGDAERDAIRDLDRQIWAGEKRLVGALELQHVRQRQQRDTGELDRIIGEVESQLSRMRAERARIERSGRSPSDR